MRRQSSTLSTLTGRSGGAGVAGLPRAGAEVYTPLSPPWVPLLQTHRLGYPGCPGQTSQGAQGRLLRRLLRSCRDESLRTKESWPSALRTRPRPWAWAERCSMSLGSALGKFRRRRLMYRRGCTLVHAPPNKSTRILRRQLGRQFRLAPRLRMTCSAADSSQATWAQRRGPTQGPLKVPRGRPPRGLKMLA